MDFKRFENMKEHNNRLKAKKFAEYITGEELRMYVANKVKKYLPELETTFDGAIGSGQLEQFLGVEKIYGVEIQEESYLTALENYPNADIECKSFFNYQREDVLCDCVIMNPPFSLKFKDLTEEEQENIAMEFPWKKSGVVDDIFVLKSLKYTKRYGFYILFPGVGYRKTEVAFRELIGTQLLELNMIQNAFEDTSISVLFLVVDKEKQTKEVKRELYDCKLKKKLAEDIWELAEDCRWEQIHEEVEEEKIDIDSVNEEADRLLLLHIDKMLALDILVVKEFGAKIDFLHVLRQIKLICKKYEKEFKEIVGCESGYNSEKLQLNLYSQEME